MEEWFETPSIPINLSNRNKVRIALFKIKGEAKEWKRSQLKRYKGSPPNIQPAWPTWAAFRADFLAKWGESNEAANALRRLNNYQWDKHKRDSVKKILTTLDTLLVESGITDEEQKKSFL